MPPVLVTVMLSLPTTLPSWSTASRLMTFAPVLIGTEVCQVLAEVQLTTSGVEEPASRMFLTSTQP